MASQSDRDLSAISVWFTSPRQIELRPSSARHPEKGEVRIQALFSGISHGSEMMVYRGEVPVELELDSTLPALQGTFSFPLRYGYASVGRVVDVGENVEGFSEGQHVFAFNPHETCYTISSDSVLALPDTVDPRNGIFAANIESALNAMLDAAPRLGESIGVIGQGVVGLLITQLARRAGAGLIVTSDLYEKRRVLSVACGADCAVDPSAESFSDRVSAVTRGRGADVVIEASGQPQALEQAIAAAAPEGRIVVVSWYGTRRAELGLGSDFHRKRVTVKSSQVSRLDPALAPRWSIARRRELAVQYLSELSLSDLITHTVPFDRVAEAYKLIDEQPGEVVQVLLKYDG